MDARVWLLAGLLSFPGLGQWSDRALRAFDAYDLQMDALGKRDPFVLSIRGALAGARRASRPKQGWTEVVFRTGITGIVSPRPGGTGAKKAPLVVVFSGVFASALDDRQIRTGELLADQGNHVLVLSSPWNARVLEHNPRMPLGFAEEEAALGVLSVDEGLERIGREAVTGLRFLGISHGGTLAAAAACLWIGEGMGQKTRLHDVTIEGPMLDLMASGLRLDALFAAAHERKDPQRCEALLHGPSRLAFAAKVFTPLGHFPDLYGRSERDCARWLFVNEGTHRFLEDSARALSIGRGRGIPPAHLLASMPFRAFVEEYGGLEAAVAFAGPQARLGTWIARAQELGFGDFRLLGAADDPLHGGGEQAWEEFFAQAPHLRHGSVRELRSGGHVGFHGLWQWYTRRYLPAAFGV